MTALLLIMLVLGVIVVPIVIQGRRFIDRRAAPGGASSAAAPPLALPAPTWLDPAAPDPGARGAVAPISYGPAMSSARPQTRAARDDGEPALALTVDPVLDVKRIESRMKMNAQQKLGEMVDRHPKLAADLVRGWLAAGPSDASRPGAPRRRPPSGPSSGR